MKRTALVICLVAMMLLALAVPAFADTSGSVYGKAVLAPYAIVISGPGTDPSAPLTYQGNLGQWVSEQYFSKVTVTNSGTQDATVRVDVMTLPTDGANTWDLGENAGPNTALWEFSDEGNHGAALVLPANAPDYGWFSAFHRPLVSGDSMNLDSSFWFPTSSSSTGDHTMSAIISAVAPV
jgi:hypothetical protein